MSVVSGIFGAEASKSAAKTQAGATDKASQTQLKMYNQTRKDMEPWRVAGKAAVNTLWKSGTAKGLLETGPGEFVPEEEPGYKFGYEEFVEKPSLRLASATGKLGSGATLKSLTRYASDYASTKYDNFLDRYYKSLDPYFRMAGLGSNVTIAGGNQAAVTGTGVASNILAGGAATAAGTLGQSSAYSNAVRGVANPLLDYASKNWGTQNSNWGGWGATTAGSAAGADSMTWL